MLRAVFLVFLGVILDHLFKIFLREKSRLVYYIQNISDHEINLPNKDDPVKIYTHSINIQNNGSRKAENVIVSHTFLPKHITITPRDINYSIDREKKIIKFKSIIPKQKVTIGYLNFQLYSVHQIYTTKVKSDRGFARALKMSQYPTMPKWFNILVYIILAIGIVTLIYILYHLIPYFIEFLKTIFIKVFG